MAELVEANMSNQYDVLSQRNRIIYHIIVIQYSYYTNKIVLLSDQNDYKIVLHYQHIEN